MIHKQSRIAALSRISIVLNQVSQAEDQGLTSVSIDVSDLPEAAKRSVQSIINLTNRSVDLVGEDLIVRFSLSGNA